MPEMKYLKNTIFFFFQLSVFLIFVKIWAPVFTFYFWLINNVLVSNELCFGIFFLIVIHFMQGWIPCYYKEKKYNKITACRKSV